MNKRMSKRGQFYLAAAIVIVVIIIGFAGISNYLKRGEVVKIYDIKDELGIESGYVLDHGIYNAKDSVGMNALLKGFTQDYSIYIEEGFNLYFIFGDETEIKVASYRDLIAGEISILQGDSDPLTIPILAKQYKETSVTPITDDETTNTKKVEVIIEGVLYPFKLKAGENFYFVIYQKTEGGTFVEKG